jgi:hypothetical protein
LVFVAVRLLLVLVLVLLLQKLFQPSLGLLERSQLLHTAGVGLAPRLEQLDRSV